MPQRPSNLDTLILALEMLKRIPRHGKISAPELQSQLKDAGLARELRTIQRQLEELSQHFEIDRDDRSKPYGYRWKDQARGLSLPTLSEQESLLLALAEQHLRTLLPASVLKSMDGFFSQARNKLAAVKSVGPDHKLLRSKESDWLRKVRVVSTTQPLLPPAIKPGIFEAVSNALYANQWLNVDYKNAQAQRKQARVMPLGLAHQGPRLYLVCRFEGYDNERSLALHRLLSVTASALTFDPPKSFDLQKFDDDGRFGYGHGKLIRLKFRVKKAAGLHVVECPLAKDQEVNELVDDYEITATVVESAQLRWWLRGFGKAAVVLEPAGLLDSA
jgi:predicted DNA-binding transcriptional regulator YafY